MRPRTATARWTAIVRRMASPLACAALVLLPGRAAAQGDDPIRRIDVNGVEMHYLQMGSGPTVLFVHGNVADMRDWQDQIDPIAETHQVVVPSRRHSFPNQNETIRPDYSAAVDADDLAALIEALGVGPVAVVGTDYGAYVALLLAIRRPDLVSSMALAEPPILAFLPDRGEAFMERVWARLRDAFLERGYMGGLEVTALWLMGVELTQVPRDLALTWGANVREWRALALSTDPFPAIDPEALQRIAVPTLILSGDESIGMNPLIDDELARLIPGARRAFIPESGHEMHRDNPEAFNAVLLEFLGRSPRYQFGEAAARR